MRAATIDIRDLRAGTIDAAPAPARWTSRVALFSVGLLTATLILHRVFSMATPVAINLVMVALAGALLSLALALVATIRIWRYGEGGAARVVTGAVVSLALLGWPAAFLPQLRGLPEINDISTDTASPPPFEQLGRIRPKGANTAAYPGAAFAKAQAEAYPDLRPLEVTRSAEEAFEIALEALRRQKMTIVREEPPATGTQKPGHIEATDRTLVVGFTDDVAVRVAGDDKRARIDIRSASRYGRHDLGRNAERARRVLKEIVARLEATVPTATGERVGRVRRKIERAVPKRLIGRDQVQGAHRTQQGRGPADARRGQEPKGSPPPRDDRRGRDRRPAQSFE